MTKISDVYKDVETFDVLKRGQLLLRLKSNEINGKSKVEIEELIGEKLGDGVYSFAIKCFGATKKNVGRIRGVTEIKNPKEKFESDNMNAVFINDKINGLEASIQKLMKSNNGTDYKQILDLQKTTFEIQLDFYKTQVKNLSDEVNKLHEKIEKFEANSAEPDSQLDKILTLIPMFLNKNKITGQLRDNTISDSTDIPPAFIDALGRVDYSQISEDQKEKILGYFNQFASQLPLKESTNNG